MPSAIVLINAEIGSEEEVFEEVSKIPEVSQAYIVYGVYDIIAKVDAKSMEELKEIIAAKIRKLPKVRSTLTMIVVEGREYRKG
uniref:Lrp/AsnC family transcriptional regulator n=1 Tax=Fervidicoccus fontis TaxID=683846 RepID=A0A7J3ZI92_9CREN